VEDAADDLAGGTSVDAILPASKVSVAKSPASFLTVNDGSGKGIVSSVVLDGQTPELPSDGSDSTKHWVAKIELHRSRGKARGSQL
jgi:hypothetical protein